jgi:hypothetical protein
LQVGRVLLKGWIWVYKSLILAKTATVSFNFKFWTDFGLLKASHHLILIHLQKKFESSSVKTMSSSLNQTMAFVPSSLAKGRPHRWKPEWRGSCLSSLAIPGINSFLLRTSLSLLELILNVIQEKKIKHLWRSLCHITHFDKPHSFKCPEDGHKDYLFQESRHYFW